MTLEERAKEVEDICLCLGLGWSAKQAPNHDTVKQMLKSLEENPTVELMTTPGDRQIMADLLTKVVFDVFSTFAHEAHKVRHITENPAAYALFMLEYCDIIRSFARTVGHACIEVAAIQGANIITDSDDPGQIIAGLAAKFKEQN